MLGACFRPLVGPWHAARPWLAQAGCGWGMKEMIWAVGERKTCGVSTEKWEGTVVMDPVCG